MSPLPKKIKLSFFIILIIVLIIGTLSLLFNLSYIKRIYPGIEVAGLNMEGKNREEAFNILDKRINYFKNQGIKLSYKQREWELKSEDINLNFSIDKTLDRAFKLGHEKNFGPRLKSQIAILLGGINIPAEYSIDEDALNQYLKDHFSFLEEKPIPAKLVLKNNHFYIIPEQEGKEVNFNKLKANIKECLDKLHDEKIEVTLKSQTPPLLRAGVLPAYQEAQEMTSKPLKLKYEEKYWTINSQKLISWIKFELSKDYITASNPAPLQTGNNLFILGNFTQKEPTNKNIVITKTLGAHIKKEEIISFLENIAPEIEQEPQNARFRMVNGKVTLFELGQDGKKIDIEGTIRRIESALLEPSPNPTKETELAVEITVPAISNKNINDLGIKTLIGTGESDFSGSPYNRRHNIRVGAGKLNGILIPPGEGFSTIKSLGEISAKTGYKPELVIKPDRTIPEFGGGLCQVSTTIFRAALYSGLPITERKPHKYVVSYYKPIGMDATIYIPHPDVRFVNDTPGHILIQSRISGNKLYFDFYGTDDNRKIEIQGPYFTSGWVAPGEPQYIETNTLPQGQKKQIERAHKGVSTVFHRIITRNQEEIAKDSFYSKYYPWKAVFLVGTGDAPEEEKKEEPKAPPPKPEGEKQPPEQEEGEEEK